MKISLPWRTLIVLGALVTLAGCSDSSVSSRDQITSTYLFYTSGAPGDYGLHAVDPDDPGNPITVEPVGGTIVDIPYYFLAGTVESGSKTIADLHYRSILYIRGAELYKVSALKSAALVKQRVSSENAANSICTGNILGFDDYNDPDQSVLFYTKDPVDAGACDSSGNEVAYMVKLGMPATTAPLGGLSTYVPVSAAYNSAGAITGFLVLNQGTGNIELRDTLLANPSAPLLSGVTNAFPAATDSNGRMVLNINSTDLYVFDPIAGTISAQLHTEVSSLAAFPMPMDSSYAYFADGNVIYRIPMNASSTSTIVIDESGGTGSLDNKLLLSRGRIVYQYDDIGADFVRSVPSSGGTATNIFNLPDNPNIRSFRAAAGRIYLSATNLSTRIAVSVGDDGSNPLLTTNAWWSGFTFHPRQALFADIDFTGRLLVGAGFSRLKARVIYQVNYSASGNTLTSYDADTTSKLVEFGVPAADFNIYDAGFGGTYPPVVHGLANNDRTLIFFDDGIVGAGQTDVIFVHARNGGSVVRVTNDTTNYNYFGIIGGCTLGKGGFDPVFPLLLVLSALYLWRRRISWTLLRQSTHS